MKKISLKRTILFEVLEDVRNIAFDYKFAVQNYDLNKRISENKNSLVQKLKIEDMMKVKVSVIDSAEDSDSDLRLYIYKSQNCKTDNIKNRDFSHALQVSLGNERSRNNWVKADEDFSAKVFPSNEDELVFLIEDIALDIQMLYYYGYDNSITNLYGKREFSKIKVAFMMSKKNSSYLGNIVDCDYISFASFCRGNDKKMDFDAYVNLWEEFNSYMKTYRASEIFAGNHIYSKEDLFNILKHHPKGGQLSLNKIKKMLNNMPADKYILIRTEKRPKDYRKRHIIENRFGMEGNWKTGKLKVVQYKYKYTFVKLEPYVSLYEFDWKG